MSDFFENPKLIVEIYKSISPIFIWIEHLEQTLQKNDTFKQLEFFQFLKEMRNEASHFDDSQIIRNESLFIKIVMIYKRFGLNLIEKSKSINRIWNGLHNNYHRKGLVDKLKDELQNIPIDYYGKYKEHLDLFKSISFSILDPKENNKNQYSIVLINSIFQYVSPIIIWHEKMINPTKTDSKLFQLVDEIKNRICHLSNINYESCTFLKEILKSIVVVYKLFGVDLKNSDPNINEIEFEVIPLCIEYKESEIREEIIKILNNEKNMRPYYVSFKELIDMLIVKVVPDISINIESVLDVKEERNIVVKDKKVQNHTIIEINNENEFFIDGLKKSNDKANENECSVWESILALIGWGGIIFGVYKLYQFLLA